MVTRALNVLVKVGEMEGRGDWGVGPLIPERPPAAETEEAAAAVGDA